MVLPEFNYYLLRSGVPAEAESYGELLDEFDGTFLVKLPGELEERLFKFPGTTEPGCRLR